MFLLTVNSGHGVGATAVRSIYLHSANYWGDLVKQMKVEVL